MKKVLLLLLCLSHLSFTHARELSDFSSDGCSAYPDGIPFTSSHEWLHCCFVHDMDYWIGGSRKEKKQADLALKQCVADSTNRAHGSLMRMGVAVGGTPFLPTRWRWGYGFEENSGYQALEYIEKEQVRSLAFTILNELSLYSHTLTDDQIIYIMNSFDDFISKIEK